MSKVIDYALYRTENESSFTDNDSTRLLPGNDPTAGQESAATESMRMRKTTKLHVPQAMIFLN